MWQAQYIAARLAEHDVPTKLVPLVSRGDTDLRPIDGTRQVGLFTKRIQEAVLAAEADIAVHSLKDLPTETDPRLTLAAVPLREAVGDCLVWPQAEDEDWVQALPRRSRVGTGSRRRAAQLRAVRPDLDVLPIRGNVQTRLDKLEAGEFDAIVLAEAGLLRLNMDQVRRISLPLETMLPAPGQGALGVEVRSDDLEATQWVARLEDPATRAAVTAERTLLATLHGGCLAPIAALATPSTGCQPVENPTPPPTLSLQARVLAPDGSQQLNATEQIPLHDPWPSTAADLGQLLGQRLVEMGALKLIQESRVC
jgi:hydroxymethylbilane synthase